MNVLALFDTTGFIIGPAMMLAGIVALVLCLRASRQPDSPRAKRVALLVSLLPFALGIFAIPFGLAAWAASGQGGTPDWLALGKACLAGLVVTAVPLVWSLLLLRPRRTLA
jgi:hypothetical protein